MTGIAGRRIGAILVIVILLSVLLVPAASASGCGVYHRVRVGETLTSIAARYHTSIYAIAQANHIANIDRIYAGQVLWIPGTARRRRRSRGRLCTLSRRRRRAHLDGSLLQQPGSGWGARRPGHGPRRELQLGVGRARSVGRPGQFLGSLHEQLVRQRRPLPGYGSFR